MKTTKLKLITANVALAAALAVVAGCVSKSYDKGAEASTALQGTADEVAGLNTKMTDVLGALNNLTFKSEGDLRKQYDAFTSAVKSLTDSTTSLESKVASLNEKAGAYLANWSAQATNISNPELQKLSETRKAEVSSSLSNVTASYVDVKTSLKPFMGDLKDIQTYLGTDLTANGIASIKDIVSKTKVDAVPLRDSLKKLSGNFSSLSAALSPVMPSAK